MNCVEWQEQIGDAVDGTLDASAQAALDAHLSSCAACRSMEADLRRIRTLAGTLDRAIPPVSAWPRIAAAIETAQRRRWWQVWRASWPMRPGWRPASAATVLVLVIAVGTWAAWEYRSQPTTPATTAGRRVANANAAATAESEIQQAEEHYNRAIATLEQATRNDAGALDPNTTAVLKTNLGVSDTAIGESQQALDADPSNEVARQSLFDALRSKVTLLEDTVALINEMRKGDQEGAARIVSGMNP
jgi:anti-sigma-K factor RskA